MKLGLCMDNFSDDFVARRASFEELVQRAAKLGYRGIEFTPAQMLASYPQVSDGEIGLVREVLSKYHMEPFCWNIYLDTGAITGRELSENEIQKTMLQNLIYAKKAGFPLIKTSRDITPRIFQKMLTLCRDLDMKLAVEIENLETEDYGEGDVQEFIRVIQGEGEGRAGLMPELELLPLPAADTGGLWNMSFGIYIRPEAVLKNRDIIKGAAEAGYPGYLLCRSGRKASPDAQRQAEQFVKGCNRVLENNKKEIEKIRKG